MNGWTLGVGCILTNNENDFTLSRTGYSAVSTYPELGDYMIINPFYINSPKWRIMGNERQSDDTTYHVRTECFSF